MKPAVLLLAALLAGCGLEETVSSGDQALEEALARARGDAADPYSLEPIPFEDAGPHRLDIEATMVLIPASGAALGLTIERRVDRGPGGAFRVVETRHLDEPGRPEAASVEGREGVFDGTRFAVRRKWAPWIERETWSGEQFDFLRQAYDAGPALLAAFGDRLRWQPVQGSSKVLGVAVRWERPELGSDEPAPLPSAAELAALRDHEEHWTRWLGLTHRIESARGRVARRQDDGQIVAGELTLGGTATVDGRTARFELSLKMTPAALPDLVSFALPDEVMPVKRERPWKMIRDVLGDELAEVYRRAR